MMVNTILWLASPAKIDLDAQNTVELVKEVIMYPMEELNSILDASLFDHNFFQILKDAYMDHLHSVILTFAMEDEKEIVNLLLLYLLPLLFSLAWQALISD